MPVDASTSEALSKIWASIFKPSDTGLETPNFTAVIAATADLGVNRYRIDFIGETVTAYVGNQADVFDFSKAASSTSSSPTPGTVKWDLAKIKAAIKKNADRAKEGRSNYTEFMTEAIAGGIVEYTVYVDGKKVIMSGVLGDLLVEEFPSINPKSANAQRLREAVGMVDI